MKHRFPSLTDSSIIFPLPQIYSDANPKICGHHLNDMTDEVLATLDIEMILAAREGMVTKERNEKIKHRKMESKRVDHLARAVGVFNAATIPETKEKLRREEEEMAAESKRREEERLR